MWQCFFLSFSFSFYLCCCWWVCCFCFCFPSCQRYLAMVMLSTHTQIIKHTYTHRHSHNFLLFNFFILNFSFAFFARSLRRRYSCHSHNRCHCYVVYSFPRRGLCCRAFQQFRYFYQIVCLFSRMLKRWIIFDRKFLLTTIPTNWLVGYSLFSNVDRQLDASVLWVDRLSNLNASQRTRMIRMFCQTISSNFLWK